MKRIPQKATEVVREGWRHNFLFEERLRWAHEAELRALADVKWLASEALFTRHEHPSQHAEISQKAALERLVKVGNRVCELLAFIADENPALAISVASKSHSWPYALRDIPYLGATLKRLLAQLQIEKRTSLPYDPIRARRHPSKAKEIAIKLKLITQSFYQLQNSTEEVDWWKGLASSGEAETRGWARSRLADHEEWEAEYRADCIKYLTDLADIVGIGERKKVARGTLAAMEDHWSWDRPSPGRLDNSESEEFEPELQILWRLTGNHPERFLDEEIGRSKKAVYERNHGTDPVKSRAGNVRAGIAGEMRQALKNIAPKPDEDVRRALAEEMRQMLKNLAAQIPDDNVRAAVAEVVSQELKNLARR